MSTIFQGPDRFLPTNYTPALGEFAGIQGSVSVTLPALVVSAAGTAGASQPPAQGGGYIQRPPARRVAGAVVVTLGRLRVEAIGTVDNFASFEADDEAVVTLWRISA